MRRIGFALFLISFFFGGELTAKKTLTAISPTPISRETKVFNLPIFWAEIPNPHDFALFANSGWDGSWYVGYNTCWIQKLPPPPMDNYGRAFLGAKLGRMKTQQKVGESPWQKQVVEGDIYIAIAGKPAWTENDCYLLTSTDDIPWEGDPENALEGVAEGQWFWVEVPLEKISFNNDNYLALYSPSETLSSVIESPILAAAWGDREENSWLNNDIKGSPPRNPDDALKTAVSVFEPAIAIKLVPADGLTNEITVEINSIKESKKNNAIIFNVHSWGEGTEKGVLEVSLDYKWIKIGRYIWQPPYIFSLKKTLLQPGRYLVRVRISDIWGNQFFSEPQPVDISSAPEKSPKK